MHDPNRMMKWILVIAMVVLSLVVLWPPSRTLKGGIDLVGGTSMLFEIDTTGLEASAQRDLSTRVMRVLRERVDPKGQLNLEWRPVGHTRLEIRMPRPPREALQRRTKYNESIDRLVAATLYRFDIESALAIEGPEGKTARDALVRGIKERTELIDQLEVAYQAHREATQGDDTVATDSAANQYEAAMKLVLDTNLPINRLTDIISLPPNNKRKDLLAKLTAQYPSFDAPGDAETAMLITRVVEDYDAWAKNKADLEDPSDLKRRIKGAGVLEFRILADRDPSSPSNLIAVGSVPAQPTSKYTEQLAKYGPRPRAGDRYRWFPIQNVLQFLRVETEAEVAGQQLLPGQPIVETYAGRHYVLIHNDSEFGLLQSTGKRKKWKLLSAFTDRDPLTGENVVSFSLDPRGGRLFGELTGSNVQRSLCIMLDNEAMSWANIRERITERCQIQGRFNLERVQNLVLTLEAGSLPARLKDIPLREQTIGPSLGESNRVNGIRAAVIGGSALALFVLFYYGIAAGGMANVALALNLLFVLAIMALMQATFTLPGIAGLILTVGMAVDANVLIFERIREEVDRGIVFKKALNAGYEKAFSTIVDANLTTLLICIILGSVGSEEVKGFAIVLGIGIVTSMFTALFVTRLVFNTLIAKGWLQKLSMRRIIGRPSIDWVGMRSKFWPTSLALVGLGTGLFIFTSMTDKERIYDIEFLGGTSVQVDLKPNVRHTDEEMLALVTATSGGERLSAVQWLQNAASQLLESTVSSGEGGGQFVVTSENLTGVQLGVLVKTSLSDSLEQDGVFAEGHTVTLNTKPGTHTVESLKLALAKAADEVRGAATRLSGARVQSVGDLDAEEGAGVSYEISTVETNRALVQTAILATLGDELVVQRRINCTLARDEELTREAYFVVETEDHYLADVVGGDANFDVRRFRGGVAIVAQLDDTERPVSIKEVLRRLREVALQPEFEQFRTRETAVFPLDKGQAIDDGETGYKRLAIVAIDPALNYEDDPSLWADNLATATHDQVLAALGREKSLSKVVQFAPQIAGQTRNKAIFAIVLALGAIVSYLWLRFGTKEYGLAAIVALVHDVTITLGLVAVSNYIYTTIVGRALMIDDFKMNLSMIAAILTVIGYSLNDTIVVFDRIRENRGRIGTLNPNLINNSINQTLSRTILTSVTTFIVVAILYVFGGSGVHGFAFALMIGVVVGTYSSVGIATPLLYRPKLLHAVITIMVALALIGGVMLQVESSTMRMVMAGVIAIGCAVMLVRGRPAGGYTGGVRAATA